MMTGLLTTMLAAALTFVPPAGKEKSKMTQSSAEAANAPRLISQFQHKATAIGKYELANGLKVIIWEDHSAPVAAYHTWFAVGSGDEQQGLTGIAHLFEHLMFKETTNLKAGEMDRLLELNGINTNAATWLDWTYYMEHLPSDRLELVMRLEADRMENMILNQEQLDTEREVVKNERLLRVDNDPEGQLYEVLYKAHFGSHPYGHPTIGWMADIEGIPLAECLDFYRVFYSPSNATVVVVGDVETAEVLALAQKYYGQIAAQPVPARPDEPPLPSRPEKQEVLPLAVSASKFIALYNGPAMGHADAMAVKVLNEVLFNSEGAPVRRRLVEDEQIATDLGAWQSSFRLAGTMELQVNLVPGASWESALAMVDEEIEKFLAGECPQRAVEGGKNRREIGFLRGNMSVGARARGLGNYEITGGDFTEFFRQPERVAAVDCEAVMRVGRELFEGRHRTVAIAVPKETP
jgi:zinc protease